MKNLIKAFVFGGIAISFFSCTEKKDANNSGEKGVFTSMVNRLNKNQKEKLKAEDYMKWLESDDNGIKINKKIGELTFTSLYKPYEYLSLKELKSTKIDKKALEEKIQEYSGMQYFTFRISAEGQSQELLKLNVSTENEYASRIEYFSFNMQKDLKLIDGTDTLDCSLFHFERVYGLAPYATFVLGFPLTKEEQHTDLLNKETAYKDKTLFYADQVFGSGSVYMTTKAESLNSLPELITN